MTDPIERSARKPSTSEDYEKPVPRRSDPSRSSHADDAPWLEDPAFAPAGTYSPALLANPALRSASTATSSRQDWPTLPALPSARANWSAAAKCATPVPAAGNAHVFADRGIPLGLALQDGAFGSAGHLEQFIDEYLAHTAARPELKTLHDDAARRGPEILATRLDTEEAEQERRTQEQQMNDRIAPLQLRAPLPIEQRAAVGEVAIPVAKAATFAGKFVPVAGQLIVLAEVVTGRNILGLGEKLTNAERALDAALLIAPHAAKALGAGTRGAAEVVRLSRATGRSADEVRALCRVAVTTQSNRIAIREGISAAKAGRAMTSEQRAAMDAVAHSVELPRRTYRPTVTNDASLPAGAGRTDKFGNVTLSTQGTAKDIALVQAHESVHSFLSPKSLNGLRELRADVRMTAYQNSALCKYIEEALAETYAQAKINGVSGIPEGLAFPIRNGYVRIHRVAGEAAVGTIVYGGVLYAVHVVVNEK